MKETERDQSPNEAEVIELIGDAEKQYTKYLELANLTNLVKPTPKRRPKYSWDNPLGFEFAEDLDVELE